MHQVRITDHQNKQTTLDVEPGSRHRIGRDSSNEVALADPSLSRTHAEIYEENGAVMLRDTNSKNGVFVNNRRIDAPVTLEPGIRVTLGICKLSLVGAVDTSASSLAVTFEDRPLPPEGTVDMQVADVLQAPTAAARDEKGFKAELEKFRTRFTSQQSLDVRLQPLVARFAHPRQFVDNFFDRVQREDMVQMSVVAALFAYNTAMLDERLPRKDLPTVPRAR